MQLNRPGPGDRCHELDMLVSRCAARRHGLGSDPLSQQRHPPGVGCGPRNGKAQLTGLGLRGAATSELSPGRR